jgi:hypothetical protein
VPRRASPPGHASRGKPNSSRVLDPGTDTPRFVRLVAVTLCRKSEPSSGFASACNERHASATGPRWFPPRAAFAVFTSGQNEGSVAGMGSHTSET